MNTKLAKKLARQNAQTESALIGYKLGQRGSTSRNNGKYKFTFADRIKL